MARFTKEIVREGNFFVSDDKGGRHETTLTREQFLRWIANYQKMRSKGYNIPAPWGHDFENGVPVRFGRDGAPKPLENAGFVEDLRLEFVAGPNGEAQAALVGEFEVPGDENDANTPAGRVGKTVKETSVYIRPSFTDGTGETYDETLMHAALVLHGIQPGQPNFTPIEKGSYAIAMSQMVPVAMSSTAPGDLAAQFDNEADDEDELRENAGKPTNKGTDTLGQLIGALRDAKLMDLPDETTEDTVLQYMLVAVRQNKLTSNGGPFVPPATPQSPVAPAPGGPPPPVLPGAGQPDQPPPGSEGAPPPAPGQQPPSPQPGLPQPPPAKSVDLRKPPKAGVEQNPPSIAMAQTDPIVMGQQIEALTGANKILAAHVTQVEADKRATRIAALVSSGRCTKEYADAHLTPMLAGFAMSIGADGKPAKAPIDTVLAALEQQPARTGSVLNTLSGTSIPGVNVDHLPASVRNQVAAVVMSALGGSIPAGATEQDIGNLFASPGTLNESEAVDTVNNFLAMVK